MSNLEELIKEYCPNGVGYKNFYSVCKYVRGITYSSVQELFNTIDGTPVLRANNIDLQTNTLILEDIKFVDESVKIKEEQWLKKDDILICAGSGSKEHIGKIAYIFKNVNMTFGGFMGVIRANRDLLLSRFLFHFLTSNMFKRHLSKVSASNSSTINNINNETWRNLQIPLPALPVQREIVRILDSFTLYSAELTAELTARRKQYEFYRDKLLNFESDSVEWKPIEKLFPLIRNGFVGTVTPYFTDKANGVRYLEGTNIHNAVISDNEELYVTKEFHKKHIRNELKADDILMVQSGHIGDCAVVGKKYAGANCHALIIMSNGGACSSKFYVHYFHTYSGFKSLAPAITGGTIQHVLAGKIGKIKVPVPPMDVQERIVNVLDNFDAICSDLGIGLPAEIEKRQKQYEYYRDKLLTF